MRQVVVICLCMLSTILLTEGVVVNLEKSKTWTWSHELTDEGISARVTVRSGGGAVAFVSYSGPATPDHYDKFYFFVEGIQTAMFFPKKSDSVNVLVRANDDFDMVLEGYYKIGKFDGCDFNFCAENEKCTDVFYGNLICTAK